MYSLEQGSQSQSRLVPSFRKQEELVRSSFRFEAYKPLLKLASYLALYYPTYHKASQHSHVQQIFSTILIVGWFFIRVLGRAGSRLGHPDYWASFGLLLQGLGCLWILFELWSKQALLHRALHNSHCMDTLKETRNAIELHSRILLKWIFGYIAAGWLLDMSCAIESVQYLNGYLNVTGLSPLVYRVSQGPPEQFSLRLLLLVALDSLMSKILIICPTLVAVSIFSVLVTSLREKLDRFNAFFILCARQSESQTTGSMLNTRSLRECRIARCDLRDILQEIDDLWSPAIFFWIIIYVLGVCSEMMRLISGDPSRPEWGHAAAFIYNESLAIYCFITWVTPCIKVDETAADALLIYQEAIYASRFGSGHDQTGPITLDYLQNYMRSNAVQEDKKHSKKVPPPPPNHVLTSYHALQGVPGREGIGGSVCEFYQQAEAMMKQLTWPPMCLTVWRYYTMNRTIALHASTATLTYMVLLLDFNPDVKDRIQGLNG